MKPSDRGERTTKSLGKVTALLKTLFIGATRGAPAVACARLRWVDERYSVACKWRVFISQV